MKKPLKKRAFFAHFSLHQSDLPLLWNRIENGRGSKGRFTQRCSMLMIATPARNADLLHNSGINKLTAELEGEIWQIRE